MSFVADELGVDVVPSPQLHREISPLYDTLSVARIVRLIQRVRPHILHTHTAKAGAVGRFAALLAGDARPPIVVHTFHGHVLRGYFGPARTAAFRSARARARAERRRGSSRSARRCATTWSRSASRRRRSSPSSGSASTSSGGSRAATTTARALRRLFGVPGDAFVVGWIGRMTAIKRVADVARAFARLRDRGVDARLCLVGDGPDREHGRAARTRARHRAPHAVRRLPARRRAVLRPSSTRSLLPVGERGHAGRRDRVARRRDDRSSRRGSAASPDVVERRRRRLPRPRRRRRRDRRRRSSSLRATRSCAGAMGAHGRARVVPPLPRRAPVDDVDALYRELLAERGPAAPLSCVR